MPFADPEMRKRTNAIYSSRAFERLRSVPKRPAAGQPVDLQSIDGMLQALQNAANAAVTDLTLTTPEVARVIISATKAAHEIHRDSRVARQLAEMRQLLEERGLLAIDVTPEAQDNHE